MNKITEAARKHATIGTIVSPTKYDSFLEGALSPETEEYYKRKYVANFADVEALTDFDPLKEARLEVINLISEGSLLRAVKYWKECNPGMGLKEAKDYVDSLRNLKS